MADTTNTGSLASLAALGDDLDNISGALGDVLGVGKGVSGSMDFVLALNDLPAAFE